MIKVSSLSLLIAGLLALAGELSAATSISPSFSWPATGTAMDTGIGLIVGGVVAVIAGSFGLNRVRAP